MAALVLPFVALLIGLVALGAAGATPRRRRLLQLSLLALGAISTAGALILFYRAGGFAAWAFVGSALVVISGVGVLAWYVLSFVGTVDEALNTGDVPPTPDFSFLHQTHGESEVDSSPKKRPSLAHRIFGSTAGDRIAKMRFLTGWSFMRRGP